jgi:Cell division protein
MEEEPSSSKSPEQSPAEEYILQVASFKNADDAEQLKVELILLNLEAQIEKARIRNGETWHRVLVGPFLSRSQRETARATLVANRYEALVLKRTAE